MMKNRTCLSEKRGQITGMPLLVILVALFLSPKMHANEPENQPNGKIISVSGYIICKGERIPDVSIDAVTTKEETVSDTDGKFSINATKGGVITFQKEGYITYEYMADEPRDNLIICLQPVDEEDEAGEKEETEQHEEIEAVIIIHTKKEHKKE